MGHDLDYKIPVWQLVLHQVCITEMHKIVAFIVVNYNYQRVWIQNSSIVIIIQHTVLCTYARNEETPSLECSTFSPHAGTFRYINEKQVQNGGSKDGANFPPISPV